DGAPIAPVAGFVPYPEALRALHDQAVRHLPRAEAKKLWDPERLVAIRQRAAARFRLDRLDRELPSMRRVADQAQLASQGRAGCVITGEAGSGKTWLARAIHQGSPVHDRAFAALDCARLPAGVLAETLFGAAGLCRRPGIGTLYVKEPSQLTH